MAELMVSTTYPECWKVTAPPLLAQQRWHEAMSGRIEGDAYWFTVGDPPEFGIAGYVVSRSDAYVYGNAGALFADAGSPFASADVAGRLADNDVSWLYPHLLLTYPGYSTFPIGPDGCERPALAAITRWARERALAAVALPYVEAGTPLARAAIELGYHTCSVTADSFLDVPPGGVPAYLARLPRKRRTAVRAERNAVRANGLRGRWVQEVNGVLLDRLAELRTANRQKYGLVADHERERARLARVTEMLGGGVDVIVIEGETGGPIVCFTLFVRDGATWHALYTGVDEDDPRSRGTYFESAFYTPLDIGPDLGVERISYGLEAGEAKRLRGCHLVPLDSALLGLTPEADQTVRRAIAAWREPR